MSWTKFFLVSIVTLAIEIMLLGVPFQWFQEFNYIVFFSFYQLLLIPSALFLLLKKFETFSISCILLLFVNFFIPSNLASGEFKTLPPNLTKKLIVRGDVMPNFEGINTISTDEMGFRSLSDIDYSNNTTFRIFAIGGSTTEELYVDDNEMWASLLQVGLTNSTNETIEVINTGVSGLRAQHHLATMLQTENYYPDAYIFLMGINDWNKHITNYFRDFNRVSPISISETLIWKGLGVAKRLGRELLSSQVTEVTEVTEEYGNYYSQQNNSLEKNDVRNFVPTEIDPHYDSMVNRIATRCNENSYLCFFVSQPSAYSTQLTDDLKTRLWMTPPNVDYTLDLESLVGIANLYNYELRKIANDNNVHFCDLANEIPPTTEYFYDDVHFNENGSAEVAKVLLECLTPILND